MGSGDGLDFPKIQARLRGCRGNQMFQLFTSIRPPADAEATAYLRDCLNSWRAAGFEAVAVNGPVETKALRTLDLPVEFSVMATDGKPRIGAFLSAIRERSCRFAGIINSDCRIAGYPGLASSLQKQLEGRALLAWRLDVGDSKPAAVRRGFDAYFFDRQIMPEDDAGFSIGDSWWDYWFPLACEMRGARIETLAFPLLTHKVHPVNWKTRSWEEGAQRFWTVLRSWRPSLPANRSLFAEIPGEWWKRERLTAYQVGTLSLTVPLWFHKERPQTIAILPSDMAETETMFRLGGQALLEASEFTIMKNMLRRSIRPLRMAAAMFRRVRQAVFAPLGGFRAFPD
jgi:hypothetical protein